MTNVGMIDVDEGAPLVTELFAVIPQDEPEMNTSDVVDVALSEEQVSQAVDAWRDYKADADTALRALRQAQDDIAAARERYVQRTGWLRDAHFEAAQAQAEREREDWVAEMDRQAQVEQSRLDAEDAEKGERLFVRVERPARERRQFSLNDAARWRLHRRDCAHATEVTRNDRDGIRMDDACDMYVAGALACGRCKPDDLMAADPVNGDAVNGDAVQRARFNRESKPVNVTEHQLKQAIKAVRWHRGAVPGLVVMSTRTFNVSDGEAVVGWHDPAHKYGHPIPAEHREDVFQEAAAHQGWTVEWNSERDRTQPGYLIVRAKTKAEIRAEKGGK